MGLNNYEAKELGDDLFSRITKSLNTLKEKIVSSNSKEKEKNIESCISKGPILDKGAVIFDFSDKSGQKWEVVVKKESQNNYKVRIKKDINGEWYTQKNGQNKTFDFQANNNNTFSIDLGKALDTVISNQRERIPNTSNEVFRLLTPDTSGSGSTTNNETKEQSLKKTDLSKKPIDLRYEEINKELPVNINYPKNHYSVEGRTLRCLRRSSITDTVEDRYGIPRGLLMALMAQEGRGDPTVINQRKSENPNQTCDGGAGLIHMQAQNAKDFGLKTIKTFNNGMIDYKHGEELEKAKAKTNNNLAKLSELDDRFNPILSVDASARFLLSGFNKANGIDARLKAANKYAGREMDDYGYAVVVYRQTIASLRGFKLPKFSKEVEKVKSGEGAARVNNQRENTKNTVSRTKQAFSNLKPKLNGKDVSYKDYCTYIENQWKNYGLDSYKSYSKEHPYIK